MLLRSFAHFNNSVFRGPDDESGGGAPVDDVANVGGADDSGAADSDIGDSDEGSKEPLTVREQIKKSMAEVNDDGQQKTEKPKRDKKTGRFGAEPAEKVAAPTDGHQEPAPAPADDIPAPASLSPEAKAAWANAPKEVKEAFVKREADMQRGVDELKQRYTQIDQALAPHTDALRQMNATPGQAVDRMFLWFKALSGTPASSFPALAQSMGIDWQKLAEATTQGQQQQPPVGQQVQQQVEGAPGEGVPEIPAPVREYIGKLEQQIQQLGQGYQQVDGRFRSMEEQVQQQNMARTTENLNIWSKDKPHFEAVRTQMAELLQSGIIPLKPDGQVDLDKAYEHAIYFNPEVRAKVIAEQQQANQQVQQEAAAATTTAQQVQVDKARKASVSIPSRGPPGTAPKDVKKKAGAKLSVRDSLKAAVAELRDQ